MPPPLLSPSRPRPRGPARRQGIPPHFGSVVHGSSFPSSHLFSFTVNGNLTKETERERERGAGSLTPRCRLSNFKAPFSGAERVSPLPPESLLLPLLTHPLCHFPGQFLNSAMRAVPKKMNTVSTQRPVSSPFAWQTHPRGGLSAAPFSSRSLLSKDEMTLVHV